ncbi:CAP domain-containing protein [archaeon]|nr:CAP domain-containing protein [archaeon]
MKIVVLVLLAFLIGCIGNSDQPLEETIDLQKLECDVHTKLNQERPDKLLMDIDLQRIARAHSRDMAENDFFNYTNLNRETPSQRAIKIGYNCTRDYGNYSVPGIAESIAFVYHAKKIDEDGKVLEYNTHEALLEQIIDGWMENPQQKEMILSNNFTRVGIGTAKGEGFKVYVTADFC